MALADLDGNGLLDVVAANSGSDDVSVLLAEGRSGGDGECQVRADGSGSPGLSVIALLPFVLFPPAVLLRWRRRRRALAR
ncbi:MAG: hypothetical protein KatS3mg076_3264 [Candidatus Binatia bacterium]|nr:MAG: hypothetical protein KatS3mg076_3264 [Candidatus Binatia bacterium]